MRLKEIGLQRYLPEWAERADDLEIERPILMGSNDDLADGGLDEGEATSAQIRIIRGRRREHLAGGCQQVRIRAARWLTTPITLEDLPAPFQRGQFLVERSQCFGQIARIDITAQQPVFEPAPLEFGSLRFEQPHAVDNVIELLFDILCCCGRGSLRYST